MQGYNNPITAVGEKKEKNEVISSAILAKLNLKESLHHNHLKDSLKKFKLLNISCWYFKLTTPNSKKSEDNTTEESTVNEYTSILNDNKRDTTSVY